MEQQKFEVLSALYELESPTLSQGDRSAIFSLSHSKEQVCEQVNRGAPDTPESSIEKALRDLWLEGHILAWAPETSELPEGTRLPASLPITPLDQTAELLPPLEGLVQYSEALAREIDDSEMSAKRFRSRVAEIIRMLAFNRQRFDLIPSTSAFTYKRQQRKRPKRDVSVVDAIEELSSVEGITPSIRDAVTLVLKALERQFGNRLARFQVEAAKAALQQHSSGQNDALAIVAGVSSGKTIAFALPALILGAARALEGKGGRVRTLFIYPRATLVEDQFQRVRAWTEEINSLHDGELLKGPALDAAGKLPKQVSSDRLNIIEAVKLAFPGDGESLEFIFTTIETLKNRLQNPYAISNYIKDLDCVVMDEVHLLDGLQGAHTAQLLSRIRAIRKILGVGQIPLRIAASATIAEPDDHVAKLFGLKRENVSTKRPLDEHNEIFSIFHHLFLRTGRGQGALSAITNGISCLIHNRSDGLAREYYVDGIVGPRGERTDFSENSLKEPRLINKTIGFVDSLSTIGSWSFTLDDNEGAILGGDFSGRFDSAARRRYPYFSWFSEPLWKIPARKEEHDLAATLKPVCVACKAGRKVRLSSNVITENLEVFRTNRTGPRSLTPPMPFHLTSDEDKWIGSLDLCPYFREGMCWWFSQDDEKQVAWLPPNLYGATPAERSEYDTDSDRTLTFAGQIRSQSLTSHQGLDEDTLLQDVNDLFRQPATQIFRLRGQVSRLRRRLDARGLESAPAQNRPWQENYSFLLASPKIEVGVDFENVRDGAMHKAIRNVASYQQKSGRVGRESNSDSVIITFMSQSPVDFYYYRNSSKLISSNHLDPIPLKTENLDVLRCHMFLGCFDFMSVHGSELMLIRGPNQLIENGRPDAVDFDQTVKSAIELLDANRSQLKNYLSQISDLISETEIDVVVEKFERILRVLDFPARHLNNEFSDHFSFATLIQHRSRVHLGPPLSDLATTVSEVQEKIRECERHFRFESHDIDLFRRLRNVGALIRRNDVAGLEDLFDSLKEDYKKVRVVLDDLDASLEHDQSFHLCAAEVIQKTNRIIKDLNNLPSDKLISCAFLSISQEYDATLARALGNNSEIPEFFYLNNLLSRLSFFLAQYPHVLPQTFFEHPKSERVQVNLGDGSNQTVLEPRPTALFDLLPGTWTYRFGPAKKSPCGRINLGLGRRIGLLDLAQLQQNGFESVPLAVPIRPDDLPEDFPPYIREASQQVEIRAPIAVRLSRSGDQVNVDRGTGLVRDDDELVRDAPDQEEDHQYNGRHARTQTLPRSLPRIWTKIEDDVSELVSLQSARRHPLGSMLLDSAKITKDLRVTQYCYGLMRTYSSNVEAPALFFTNNGRAFCLGDQMITDGIVLTLSKKIVGEILDEVLVSGSGNRSTLIRKAFAGFLMKACGASLFTANRMRETLISIYVGQEKSLVLEVDKLQAVIDKIQGAEFEAQLVSCEIIKEIGADPDQIDAARERANRYIEESQECLASLKEKIGEFSEKFVRDWTLDVLCHSIALNAFQAACRTAGVGGDQLGYFYKSDPEEFDKCKIFLFDKTEGGSGLCNLIDRNFFISQKERKDNDQLATTDFLSEWAVNMGACPTHLVHRICDTEATMGNELKLPSHLSHLQSDLVHCRETLHTNEIIGWMQKHAGIPVHPGRLDDLVIANDAADQFLPEMIEQNVISAEGAFHKFERAISGCVDGCPECVLDTENSVYGQFLTADHSDSRLSTLYLSKAAQKVGAPSIYTARSAEEIRALKLGVVEGGGTTLSAMANWITEQSLSPVADETQVELAFLFDPGT